MEQGRTEAWWTLSRRVHDPPDPRTRRASPCRDRVSADQAAASLRLPSASCAPSRSCSGRPGRPGRLRRPTPKRWAAAQPAVLSPRPPAAGSERGSWSGQAAAGIGRPPLAVLAPGPGKPRGGKPRAHRPPPWSRGLHSSLSDSTCYRTLPSAAPPWAAPLRNTHYVNLARPTVTCSSRLRPPPPKGAPPWPPASLLQRPLTAPAGCARAADASRARSPLP